MAEPNARGENDYDCSELLRTAWDDESPLGKLAAYDAERDSLYGQVAEFALARLQNTEYVEPPTVEVTPVVEAFRQYVLSEIRNNPQGIGDALEQISLVCAVDLAHRVDMLAQFCPGGDAQDADVPSAQTIEQGMQVHLMELGSDIDNFSNVLARSYSKGIEEDIDLLGVDIAQRYDELSQNLSETDVKEQQTYEVGYSGSNDAVTVSNDKTPKRRVLDAFTFAAGVTIGLSVHGLAKALKNRKKF